MIYDKIFPLADSLQMELKVFKRGETRIIKGEREFSFPLSKVSDLKVKAIIEGSYVGNDESALYLRVGKTFGMYMIYSLESSTEGTITLHILDLKNQNTSAIKSAVACSDVETAMMAFAGCKKVSFAKKKNDIDWHPIS